MPRPIAIDDFYKIRLVSDPQIAPDGGQIACVVTRIDRDKNKYLSEIQVVPTESGEPRTFTSGDSSARHPRWSPDGTQIAFLSDRQKPNDQIYLLPADGGEARALTSLDTEGSIGGLRWSPDGSKIAFLFRETPPQNRKAAKEEREKSGASSPVRHHTRLNYRFDGMGYYDDAYPQIWVADAHTGAWQRLTDGPYSCDLPTWSPDSKTLAFVSDRRDDRDIAPSQDDIWTTSADGGELTRIPSPPGTKDALAWSPDGTQFAYVGNPDPADTWGTTNNRLFVLPSTGSETARDLTGPTDKHVGWLTLSDTHEIGAGDMVQWTQDSKRLYFPISHFGATILYYANLDDGKLERIAGDGEVGGISVAQDGITVAWTEASSTMPHELYAGTLKPPFVVLPMYKRTALNSDFLAEVKIETPLDATVIYDRDNIRYAQGWLLHPAGFDESAKYPLVVYVHGGPHAQYGHTFFHELQWLAAEGYVVLYTNPRGSKGYGEAHTKAIKGAWGGVDYDDIMAATDYACGLNYVDASRTAIMGGSYGGYMTAWAVGHTDRFRCAIADRLVANLPSMSGTCDFAWKPDLYYAGSAWDRPDALWRCSPLAYAARITTPLLLIHSDGDLRCPAGQAEEMFAALRLQRKTVEYIRYPAESSHGLSRNGPPDLRLDRLQRNIEWLNRWLKA